MVARKHVGAALLVLLVLLASGAGYTQAQPNAAALEASLKAGRPFVAGELLVQFKPGASEAAKAAALSRQGVRAAQKLLDRTARKDAKGDLVQVQLGKGKKVDAALLARLAADPAVDFVEPNWIYRTQQSNPNDPGAEPALGHAGRQHLAHASLRQRRAGCLERWRAVLQQGPYRHH